MTVFFGQALAFKHSFLGFLGKFVQVHGWVLL
jgi:hypothetical protein